MTEESAREVMYISYKLVMEPKKSKNKKGIPRKEGKA
jgi:hypothetical protein